MFFKPCYVVSLFPLISTELNVHKIVQCIPWKKTKRKGKTKVLPKVLLHVVKSFNSLVCMYKCLEKVNSLSLLVCTFCSTGPTWYWRGGNRDKYKRILFIYHLHIHQYSLSAKSFHSSAKKSLLLYIPPPSTGCIHTGGRGTRRSSANTVQS